MDCLSQDIYQHRQDEQAHQPTFAKPEIDSALQHLFQTSASLRDQRGHKCTDQRTLCAQVQVYKILNEFRGSPTLGDQCFRDPEQPGKPKCNEYKH